jgi:hypothetical protein
MLVVGLSGAGCQKQEVVAQESVIPSARQVVDTLCSPVMAGRGYVNNGTQKAADYLKAKFRDYGVKRFKHQGKRTYEQAFRFEANKFPRAMFLKMDGRELEPGIDYLVKPESGGTETKRFMGAVSLKPGLFSDAEAFDSLADRDLSNKCAIVNKDTFQHYEDSANYEAIRGNEMEAGALIYLQSDDLVWGKGTQARSYPVIEVKKSAAPPSPQMVHLEVEQQYETFQPTQNVIGYIKGKEKPDQFIVFSAHYDHLGRMGQETYFPGANDNASGVAMMLNLARYFSKPNNKPRYSLAFMAFTGEEAGLLGSRHYTQNPFFPLDDIRFLLNLDLFGSGEKGMMTVNGGVHEEAFQRLQQLNQANGYLPEIKARGRAANSDHYFFSQKGVPAFFCYLMADYPHYHDPKDDAEALPYENYQEAFQLLVDYTEGF